MEKNNPFMGAMKKRERCVVGACEHSCACSNERCCALYRTAPAWRAATLMTRRLRLGQEASPLVEESCGVSWRSQVLGLSCIPTVGMVRRAGAALAVAAVACVAADGEFDERPKTSASERVV